MEINGSDAFIYMMYDKELLYLFDYFNTDYKKVAIEKHVNVRCFMKIMKH